MAFNEPLSGTDCPLLNDTQMQLDEDFEEYQELVDDALNDRKSKDPSSLPVTHSTFIAWLSSVNAINAKKDWNWDELYKKYNPYLISSKDHVELPTFAEPDFITAITTGVSFSHILESGPQNAVSSCHPPRLTSIHLHIVFIYHKSLMRFPWFRDRPTPLVGEQEVAHCDVSFTIPY